MYVLPNLSIRIKNLGIAYIKSFYNHANDLVTVFCIVNADFVITLLKKLLVAKN